MGYQGQCERAWIGDSGVLSCRGNQRDAMFFGCIKEMVGKVFHALLDSGDLDGGSHYG